MSYVTLAECTEVALLYALSFVDPPERHSVCCNETTVPQYNGVHKHKTSVQSMHLADGIYI